MVICACNESSTWSRYALLLPCAITNMGLGSARLINPEAEIPVFCVHWVVANRMRRLTFAFFGFRITPRIMAAKVVSKQSRFLGRRNPWWQPCKIGWDCRRTARGHPRSERSRRKSSVTKKSLIRPARPPTRTPTATRTWKILRNRSVTRSRRLDWIELSGTKKEFVNQRVPPGVVPFLPINNSSS